MGLHLTANTLWDDLKLLQYYGNAGTHAHGYLRGEAVSADAEVLMATCRVLLVFAHQHIARSKL